MMMEVLLGSLRPVGIIKNIQSLEIPSETILINLLLMLIFSSPNFYFDFQGRIGTKQFSIRNI